MWESVASLQRCVENSVRNQLSFGIVILDQYVYIFKLVDAIYVEVVVRLDEKAEGKNGECLQPKMTKKVNVRL